MNLLAIELSSRRGSVALWRDGVVVREREWEEPDGRRARVFEMIPDVVENVANVDVFVAGCGPGVFSGMRVAVTAVQALALPLGRKALAVSSGAALARATLASTDAPRVAVIGDARRGLFWYGVFERGFSEPVPWSLCPVADLDRFLPPETVRVSSDWDRVAPQLTTRSGWVQEPRFPAARYVAELAAERLAHNGPTEPLAPIYLHPAV